MTARSAWRKSAGNDALVEEALLASRLDATEAAVAAAARAAGETEGVSSIVNGAADMPAQRRLHRAGGGRAELGVWDRGPGVPEDCRERIFEPFFRMPGHAEREGGVGLGLALVRQIAAASRRQRALRAARRWRQLLHAAPAGSVSLTSTSTIPHHMVTRKSTSNPVPSVQADPKACPEIRPESAEPAKSNLEGARRRRQGPPRRRACANRPARRPRRRAPGRST